MLPWNLFPQRNQSIPFEFNLIQGFKSCGEHSWIPHQIIIWMASSPTVNKVSVAFTVHIFIGIQSSEPPSEWPIKFCLQHFKTSLACSHKSFYLSPTNQFSRPMNHPGYSQQPPYFWVPILCWLLFLLLWPNTWWQQLEGRWFYLGLWLEGMYDPTQWGRHHNRWLPGNENVSFGLLTFETGYRDETGSETGYIIPQGLPPPWLTSSSKAPPSKELTNSQNKAISWKSSVHMSL